MTLLTNLPDGNALKEETMGEVKKYRFSLQTKLKEAPYDYNARYVDNESNPLYLLNPKM